MTDLIGSLVERELGGGAEVLSPRLTSMFEPPSRTPEFEPLIVDVTVESGGQESAKAAQPAGGTPRPQVADRVRDHQHELTSDRTAPAALTSVQGPVNGLSKDSLRIEPRREEARTQLIAEGPALPSIVESHRQPDPGPGATLVPVRTGLLSEDGTRAPVKLVTHDEPPQLQPIDRKSIASDRVEVSPVQNPRAAPQSDRSDTPRMAADTVVQISIGRLEVRAAPSARESRPRRPEPESSRLDEYLRQRTGKPRQ
jgi:hypothetical protein